jgi:regulatory protein
MEGRTPKPASAASLEAAALFYLERFASSAANLRRVLLRRVRRSAALHGTDPEAGTEMIEALIKRFIATGLLDDRVYAEAKSASLHRRGASSRAIAAKLSAQGLERDLITAALSQNGDELEAAAALARRRRLGPFRPEATRDANCQKDLATLARAGFSRRVAEQVLQAEDPAALDEALAGAG